MSILGQLFRRNRRAIESELRNAGRMIGYAEASRLAQNLRKHLSQQLQERGVAPIVAMAVSQEAEYWLNREVRKILG